MFRFETYENLYALIGIPILIVLFFIFWSQRKKAIDILVSSDLRDRVAPYASANKHFLKFGLVTMALLSLIIGYANPQWAGKRQKVQSKGVDVFIAIDISNSMLAEDVKPSRMERAQRFAQNLVAELKGERIGTIIFAGSAYLQMPLTTDYAAATMFVKSANPNLAPSQGTAIEEAIDLAERNFEVDSKHHKSMIIISDGENHEPQAIERAKEANENGLLIYTVGVGTEAGGLIPIFENGRKAYKKDKSGSTIKTALNEQMLRDLADAGRGEYYNLNSGNEIVEAIKKRIDKIEKRELEHQSFTDYESYFQYFVGLGLLLLVIDFLIGFRKSKVMEETDIFSI